MAMCGSQTARFDTICSFALFLEYVTVTYVRILSLGGKIFAVIGTIANQLYSTTTAVLYPQQPETSFFTQLKNLYMEDSIQATDPRDRIFAVMGLQTHSGDTQIIVDYAKPWTDIYRECMEIWIQQFGLSTLGYCCWADHADQSLVSWVIDWRQLYALPIGRSVPTAPFSASGSSQHLTNICFPRLGCLRVSGFVVDIVKSTGRVGRNRKRERSFEDYLKWMAELTSLIATLGVTAPLDLTKEQKEEILWKTAIADCIFAGGVGERRAEAADLQMYQAFHRLIHSKELDSDRRVSYGYRVSLKLAQDARRPFIAPKGYIGIGPRHCQAGDLICIFIGAPTPFIVRKAGTKGEYHLVGDAYVHGIMDGELMKGNPQTESFDLV